MGAIFSGPTPASYNYRVDWDSDKVGDPSGELDVAPVMERIAAAMAQVENYKSCQPDVKKAIEAPKDIKINTDTALALTDNILAIKSWYDLAEDVAVMLPKITGRVAGDGTINESPMLVAALAKIVAFVYRFDQAKMYESGIQNDFSGYRRVMNKTDGVAPLPLDESTASVVSMFVAQPGPFAHRLGVAFSGVDPARKTVLAELANAACGAVDRSKGKSVLSDQQADFCRHVMVGAIILYDRGLKAGASNAFNSRELAILKCCTTAKKRGGADSVKLCSAIQYSTANYSTAPERVQEALEE